MGKGKTNVYKASFKQEEQVLDLSPEFKLRASCLQSRCSTILATPATHFALVILEVGFVNYLPGLASNLHPPNLSASKVARITDISHLPVSDS
jgi:hypothetical protein